MWAEAHARLRAEDTLRQVRAIGIALSLAFDKDPNPSVTAEMDGLTKLAEG